MMLGNLLIYAAVVTSVASTGAFAWVALQTRSDEPGPDSEGEDDGTEADSTEEVEALAGNTASIATYARYLVFASAGLFVAAFGFLIYQFVSLDYLNQYVWKYSGDYLSVFYRMTGTYAGVNGSLLLWAALVAVCVAWLVRRVPDAEHALVAAIGTGVMSVFAFMSVNRTPFEVLSFDPGGQIFGPRGLIPLLVNPYMGIHPPITFAGYALTVPAFAIATAHLLRRLQGKAGLYKRWLPRTMSWLRLSWWTLTAAVALGALWSYNTLGWGGLWAWDPVETAVLVSWLIVSMTVHAVANYRRRGQNRLLAPGMTALALPGVLFARLITQSGTSPLHSFGVGFSNLLGGLLVVTFLLAVAPPLYLWLRAGEEADADLNDSLLSLGNMMFLSVLVIGVLTFISVWGIGLPAFGELLGGTELDIGVNFYNLWSYPVAVAMLLLLGLYNDYVANGRDCLRMFYLVVAVTVIVAVIPLEGWKIAPDASGLFYSILGQVNALVLFPPVAYVFLGVSDRLMTVIPRLQTRDEKIALTGRGLVHLGLALIILAAPFTYLFAASGAGMVPIGAQGMGAVTLGDSPYAASVDNYNSEIQPAVVEFSDAEKETIIAELERLALTPDQVAGQERRSALVRGEITDYRTNSQSVSFQLSGDDVWVPVGQVTNPDDLLGSPLWIQGQVSTSESGATTIDYRFIGLEPTNAIVPQSRFQRHTADLTIYKNGNQLTSGTAAVRNNFIFGSVSEVYIDHGLLKDTYVSPQQVQTVQGTQAIYLTVKEVPLMNLVRLGIALMLLGGLLIWRYDNGTAEDWD